MRSFIKKYVRDTDDWKVFLAGIVVMLFGVGLAVATSVRLAIGAAENEEALRFFSSAGLVGIGVICLAILKFSPRR
jgi:hypothetical protein